MKKIPAIILFGLFSLVISCSSPVEKAAKVDADGVKTELDEIKEEILGYLDSTNRIFDQVISDHNNGKTNDEIYKQYGLQVELLETKVDLALEKFNRLIKDGKISEKAYENWVKEVERPSVHDKHKKIAGMGINFAQLPITEYYNLNQVYVDSTHHFSIRFPGDWTIKDNVKENTLMATGYLHRDSGSDVRMEEAFWISIAEMGQEYTTDEYYKGNMSFIKEGKSLENEVEFMAERELDLNGIPTKYVMCRTYYKGLQLVSIQVYFATGTKGYLLSGSANWIAFEDYRDLFVEIARTFVFIKPEQ